MRYSHLSTTLHWDPQDGHGVHCHIVEGARHFFNVEVGAGPYAPTGAVAIFVNLEDAPLFISAMEKVLREMKNQASVRGVV